MYVHIFRLNCYSYSLVDSKRGTVYKPAAATSSPSPDIMYTTFNLSQTRPLSSILHNSNAQKTRFTTTTPVPEEILSKWHNWSARARIVGLRRWIMDLEWTHGTLHSWTLHFNEGWAKMACQSADALATWLELNEGKAAVGRMALGYLGRVMDGEVSGDIDEWRDLALQVHELTAMQHQAVAGLEVSLHWTVRWSNSV